MDSVKRKFKSSALATFKKITGYTSKRQATSLVLTSSIKTLSPTKILTKFFRIFPLIVAKTGGCVSGVPSIVHRNMAFGRLSMTTPSTSITSSFTFLTRSVLFFRSLPCARASFLPNNEVELGANDVEVPVVSRVEVCPHSPAPAKDCTWQQATRQSTRSK
jgi:hypothetical protein